MNETNYFRVLVPPFVDGCDQEINGVWSFFEMEQLLKKTVYFLLILNVK